jgi:hypothetical protein
MNLGTMGGLAALVQRGPQANQTTTATVNNGGGGKSA